MTRHPGIWILDANGNGAFADDSMADILGAGSRHELIGHRVTFPGIPELNKQAGTVPVECWLRRKDGSDVFVRVQTTALHNDAGEFTGMVTLFTPLPPDLRQQTSSTLRMTDEPLSVRVAAF
jgi:PAS domain-containing protein